MEGMLVEMHSLIHTLARGGGARATHSARTERARSGWLVAAYRETDVDCASRKTKNGKGRG